MKNKLITLDNTEKKLNLLKIIAFIIVALISFFIVSERMISVDAYPNTLQMLTNLQGKALGLTATSTALATGAAAIPGDATTPVATKLADIAGYMVIIYVAIIFEKYLLTMMGFIAFKILIPIGCGLQVLRCLLRKDGTSTLSRLAIKLIILGLLFWALVPTSAWVSNWIDNNYQDTWLIESEVLDDVDLDVIEEELEASNDDSGFSVGSVIESLADKVGETAKNVGKATSEKIEQFQTALNQLIEAVAVMIVITCVIPVVVLLSFIWILNSVMGLSIKTPSLKSLPKASKLFMNGKNKEEFEEE